LSVALFIEETDATNELIDDNPDLVTSTQSALLSSEEIADLRNQGFTAEDIIQMQIERHDRFGLKTEFSKDKWKKRKEKR
jgi:tRNA (adenine-N(1)-)-methyltransferase non-catalytic subunit